MEQVLNWWLLRAKIETDAVQEQIVERLQAQLDEGMKSLWEDHTQVKAIGDGENADPQRQQKQQQQSEEVQKPTSKETTVATTTTATKKSDELEPGTFRVDIVGGHYTGESFVLKPSGSKFCWIGRSQSKKFTKNGISLPHDAEVSTSHGKFLPSKGGFVYIDDGSTNGSWINGAFIERHAEYPLENGMEIVVGATSMKITLSE